MTLSAKMWVDGEFVTEVPNASLIRCVHPRTQFGHQYQLYGVQASSARRCRVAEFSCAISTCSTGCKCMAQADGQLRLRMLPNVCINGDRACR